MRYNFNKKTKTTEKLLHEFTFTDTLTIKTRKYKLNGFLVHSGKTYKEGHYYSYINDLSLNQWYKFDDYCVIKAKDNFM